MPDDRHPSDWTVAQRQAQEAAALIDAAADDLERNGPVPQADLRQRLLALEAEWAAEEADKPPAVEADRRPR